MFRMHFNQDGSIIWQDAKALLVRARHRFILAHVIITCAVSFDRTYSRRRGPASNRYGRPHSSLNGLLNRSQLPSQLLAHPHLPLPPHLNSLVLPTRASLSLLRFHCHSQLRKHHPPLPRQNLQWRQRLFLKMKSRIYRQNN